MALKYVFAALLLTAAHPAMADDTADSALALAKARTSVESVTDRPNCYGKDAAQSIVVCGKRSTSRYRYGQRGLPYSKRFKGYSPNEVANALAGVVLPHFNRADWAMAVSPTPLQQSNVGTFTGGLAQILDPLNLGYGTRNSREIFWAQQAVDIND